MVNWPRDTREQVKGARDTKRPRAAAISVQCRVRTPYCKRNRVPTCSGVIDRRVGFTGAQTNHSAGTATRHGPDDFEMPLDFA